MALAVVILLALAASTPAARASSLSYDGDALVYTASDDDGQQVQFRLDLADGRDHVIDDEVIDDFPNDCVWETSFHTWVSCPGSLDVRVELRAGNDEVIFRQGNTLQGDCFDHYVLNLGDGDNKNDMNLDCTNTATLAITAGSGEDELNGGAADTSSTITAGGGNDKVNRGAASGPSVVHGGDGDDWLYGAGGNDQVYGEGGNDKIQAGYGDDVEDGGAGDDTIGFESVNSNGQDDQGADKMRGGEGYDMLYLTGHTGGMKITLDNQPDDGSIGEGDDVGSDIEWILGTARTDDITGTDGPDSIDGFAGSDVIHGGGGDDYLIGSDGDDSVFGDAGNDQVEGRYGVDMVDGGPGTDQLYGDINGCAAYCEPDNDLLFAQDGERDNVYCGGPGKAYVDEFDVVASCGSVERLTLGGGDGGGGGGVGDGGGGGDVAQAGFAGSKRSLKVNRKGRFSYSFRAGAGLSGRAVFASAGKVRVSRRARLALADRSFTVPSSGGVTLKIKLSRRNLAILRRNGKIKAKVTVTLENGVGGSSVASTTLTLKR